MGHEFITGSTKSTDHHPLYSFSTHDDLNFWTVPTELLGNNKNWGYSCLSNQKRFVTYGYNKDGTIVASTIVGNRGSQQLSRYSSVVTGVTASAGRAYEGFQENIIHWFTTDEGPLFFETFAQPVLEIKAPKVEKETDVDVTFTFTNNGTGKKSFTKKITVVP